MPSDLSISSIPPMSGAEVIRGRAGTKAEEPAPAATPQNASATMPNPRLRIEGDLGMVVIEFRNRYGEVANTVPSARELASYQTASRTGDAASLPTSSTRTPDKAPEALPGHAEASPPEPGPLNDTATVFAQPSGSIPTASVPATAPAIPQQGTV